MPRKRTSKAKDISNDTTLTSVKIINEQKKVKIKYIPYNKSKLINIQPLIIISTIILAVIIIFFIFIIKNNYSNTINKKSNTFEHSFDKIAEINSIFKNNSLIYFKKNTSILNDGETNKIDVIINALKMCDSANIEISGYTANIEKPENEIFLSQRRADYIKSLIEKNIINYNIKISAKGYGSSNEVTKDPSKLYLNRRVEIKISDIKLKKY